MSKELSLRLYNTLERRVEPVVLSRPGVARVYQCGVTPYDESHAGHGRTATFSDLLVRHLTASGVPVEYVRNITDVEDKILRRARERGEEPLDLSARFAKMYQEDVRRIGCLAPTHEPKVSETIPEIIALTQRLIDLGVAYEVETENGKDVWYSIKKFADYGKLSRRDLTELRSGAGLEDRAKETHADKRDPLDFALWKSAPAGEWAFDSPWGRGRPGWHIECSAMCERHLGFGIDVHMGGMDLIFPHHENEIAQSEAARPGEGSFARIWIHGGFLNVRRPDAPRVDGATSEEGEKMSKSLGNFVTMRDCFDRNDPEALRYFYLTAHYRGPLEFEREILPSGRVIFPPLDEAERRVDYLYQTRDRLSSLASQAEAGAKVTSKEVAPLAEVVRSVRKRMATALDDDLNAPLALSVVNDLAKASNDLSDLAQKRRKDAALVASAAALAGEAVEAFALCSRELGILQSSFDDYATRTRALRLKVRGLDPAEIDAKVAERRQARDAKDFALGDAIRADLAARGVELLDSPTGTTWRVLV